MTAEARSTPGDGVVDLFSGAGGWDVALAQLGISGVVGYEKEPWAAATARAAGFHVVQGDLTQVDVAALGLRWGLVGSPPCQAWSSAGKQLGKLDQRRILWILARIRQHTRDTGRDTAWQLAMADDDAAHGHEAWNDEGSRLVLEPIRWVLATRPRWIGLEQVSEVLPFWMALAELLKDLGFSVWAGIMDAEQYGVPQTRDRAILIASLDRRLDKPPATHHAYDKRAVEQDSLFAVDMLPWVSMADALGWGMTERPSITLTSGGPGGGCRILDGGSGARAVLQNAQDTGRWVEIDQARDSGPGADREPRPATAPSYTIRAQGSGSNPSGTKWVLRSNQATDRRPLPLEKATRPVEAPSLTITTSARLFEFVPIEPQVDGITGQAVTRSATFGERPGRTVDEPSFTIVGTGDGGGGTSHRHEWLTEDHWAHDRSSTTVQGDPRVADPGHKDRAGGERQFSSVSARVTEAEAACLQSFPAGYPWKGGRTAVFAQIGNAIPPLLALAAAGHAIGDTTWQDVCRAAYT